MKNQYSAHMIVEAALMAALVVVFTLMAAYVPILGTLCIFIAPIPIAILNIKYNYKIGICTVVVSAIIVGMFSSIITAVLSMIIYAPCGLVLGVCIRKNKKPLFTAVILTITNIISIIGYLVINIYVLMSKTFMDMANEVIKTMHDAMSMYEKMGIDMKSNPAYTQMMSVDAKTLLMFIPVVIFAYAAFSSIITYNISRKLFSRLNININVMKMADFSDWYIGVKAGAVLILIVCIAMFAVQKNVPYAEYLMSGSYTVFALMMMVSGLSVIDYFLINRFKMSKVMAAVICAFIIFTSLSILALSLGITDLIFDIRGKDENSIGSSLRRKINSK